jgi:hypothetical protein
MEDMGGWSWNFGITRDAKVLSLPPLLPRLGTNSSIHAITCGFNR